MLDAEGMAILNKAKRSLDSGNLDFGDHFGKNRRPPLSFQSKNAHREKGSSWRPLFVYLPFWVVCGGNFRLWEGKRECEGRGEAFQKAKGGECVTRMQQEFVRKSDKGRSEEREEENRTAKEGDARRLSSELS